MPLVRLENVSIAFGSMPLLERAGLEIEPAERVCLIGRNGAGKSTLLKLLEGDIGPDAGEVWRQPNLRLSRLAQDLPDAADGTVFDHVASGLVGIGELLGAYHHAAVDLAQGRPGAMQRVEQLQHELEARDGWRLNQRVETALSRLGLDPDASVTALSGGWRRRLALARALVLEPDLLLLDEPTNHLDIDAIRWLEEQLMAYRGGLLFVTHDRALLERLATRIVELDRGRLTSWPGDYGRYLERKAAALAEEERQNALFDKKLAREEAWIRQGIQARRTRNEGRVRALKALREERRQRREREGRSSFGVELADASGRLVIEAVDVTYAIGGNTIASGFSTRIMRGDRIGLIGPNGVGKTTLLRLLLGEVKPLRGTIRHGTRLEIAYFDQLRSRLDPKLSVLDSLSEGREFLDLGGARRHVISYLQDFLFPPDRIRAPVASLSGGERNRLLLARLFSQACNVLVMDEPTNDLDLETLELLEERLGDFRGTLLLVSHDRAFLDNVVTSTLVFEAAGRVREYVGGYSDWLRQKPTEPAPVRGDPGRSPESATRSRSRKLGYREQRELDTLPGRIEALEAEQADLQRQVSDPDFYRGDAVRQAHVLDRLTAVANELEQAYTRWEVLESG